MNNTIEETKDQIIIPENEILDYLMRKEYIKSNWYEQIASSLLTLDELLPELKESCFDQIHQRHKEYGNIYIYIFIVFNKLQNCK